MIYNNICFRGICIILLILILSACATAPQRETTKSAPSIKAAPVLPIDAIDQKISSLQDLLDNNKVLEKERETVSNLIYDYQRIKVLLLGDLSESDLREIILIIFNDLNMLDEKYLAIQSRENNEIYARAINDLYIRKQGIYNKYVDGDYMGVISEWDELEETFGEESMTFETGILLAMSLANEGSLAEAIDIGNRIINELEGILDLVQLRARLIEWQIETKNKENALKDYQSLIEVMEKNQGAFNKTTTSINSQDKKITESDSLFNRLMDEGSNSDINTRISVILREVNNLIDQKDFTGARLLLLKWKLRTDEPVETTEIESTLNSLDLYEKQYQEDLINNKNEGIEEAKRLIEDEDYESAISILDFIINGGNSNPEIDKQRKIAVERLINKERNRAAKIFLTARKTDDIKKKEELLISAQDILSGLIEKYPLSDLIEKLNSNLASVNDELKKIRDY